MRLCYSQPILLKGLFLLFFFKVIVRNKFARLQTTTKNAMRDNGDKKLDKQMRKLACKQANRAVVVAQLAERSLHTRDPRFESSHWQFERLVNCIEKPNFGQSKRIRIN